MDITKELKNAIAHRIACIEGTYINGFAGTGRSRTRDSGDVHSIARKITGSSVFEPFAFRWTFGNGEPAGSSDIYLTVFTALFDIDDDDAKRWASKTEGDIAASRRPPTSPARCCASSPLPGSATYQASPAARQNTSATSVRRTASVAGDMSTTMINYADAVAI